MTEEKGKLYDPLKDNKMVNRKARFSLFFHTFAKAGGFCLGALKSGVAGGVPG